MRVLVLTQHFTPEVTAGRFRIEAFVEELVNRGNDVDVICPVPNHPQGVIQPGYRGRPLIRRRVSGADVTYVWVTTSPRKTFVTRLGYYGSFAAAASTVGALRAGPDVIVASSPPLPVGAAGAVLAARYRTPWVLDARDLWPESAVALGELRDRRLIALAERLERRLYSSAATVITVNDAFRRQIAVRAPAATIEVIPNGTRREWLEASTTEPDRDSLGLPRDRFIWAYAGNLGLAHGLEVGVEAAEALGDSHLLLIIGEGPRRAAVERRAADLPNTVELRPLMPPAHAAEYLRAADALLVSESQERTVPSKLYDCCAIGRPVIAACRGEMRRVVEEAGIGLTVPYGDPDALAAAVRKLGDDPALRGRLCVRGREFARAHLRPVQAERFADLVERTASHRYHPRGPWSRASAPHRGGR